jgi:hypothetical protein
METLHDEAARLGVERPELEHYEYTEGDVTVISLTPDSDRAWSDYLRKVTMARMALGSEIDLSA